MKNFKIHTIGLFALSALLSGAFASCVKEMGVDDGSGDRQKIVIGLGSRTRSYPIETVGKITDQKFGLVAWHVKPSPATTVEYIDTYGEVDVDSQFGDSYYYADLYDAGEPETYYWPNLHQTGDSLKFTAWYPYGGAGAPTGVLPGDADQSVSMDFDVQGNTASQVDLMAATHTPSNWGGNVQLNFYHALTRLRFSFRKKEESGTDYVVSKIELRNVVTGGTLTVAGTGTSGKTPSFIWYGTPTGGIFWKEGQGGGISVTSADEYANMDDTDTFMTIPMNDASTVEIELTLKYGDEEVIKRVRLGDYTVDKVWVAGKYIDYKFTIAAGAPPEVSLEADVLDWNKVDQKVIFDGQYYLKVSKDDVFLSASGTDEVIFTAQTDYTGLNLSQGYKDGIWIDNVEYYDSSGNPVSENWITLGNNNGSDGSSEREIKITAKSNGNDASRRAKIYVRAGNMTKVIAVEQLPKTPDPLIEDDELTPTTYVGAFWRADQLGERLIRIPAPASVAGKWAVQVIEYGYFEKGDIVFSTEMTRDQGVTWDEWVPESPADMNMPINDAIYQVTGNETYITGSVNAGDHIFFRIGLKSKWTTANGKSADKPARYAVILLSYKDYTLHQKIWLRQGHEDDYLMRTSDNFTLDGTNYKRNLAVKISPYNLTAPEYKGVDNTAHFVSTPIRPSLAYRYFADYPSQAGAFYQFSPDYEVRAFHPSLPNEANRNPDGWQATYFTDNWSQVEKTAETCPDGYHRPGDGQQGYSSASPRDSEIAQTLWLKPQDPNSNNTDGVANVVWGYLADGFFDRRVITSQPSRDNSQQPNSAVAMNTSLVAYNGMLFYNPTTHASVFFPAGGYRISQDNDPTPLQPYSGNLSSAGSSAYYWTSTNTSSKEVRDLWLYGSFNEKVLHAKRSTGLRNNGFLIRCVAGNTPPSVGSMPGR